MGKGKSACNGVVREGLSFQGFELIFSRETYSMRKRRPFWKMKQQRQKLRVRKELDVLEKQKGRYAVESK